MAAPTQGDGRPSTEPELDAFGIHEGKLALDPDRAVRVDHDAA
jgi:hypothetical protein